MAMLKLDVYTPKDLQNFKSILDQCNKSGIILISKLYDIINENLQINESVPYAQIDKKEFDIITCPECEKDVLTPVLNSENLRILGCRKCRFSMVLER